MNIQPSEILNMTIKDREYYITELINQRKKEEEYIKSQMKK
jgi:hypothetical protein